MKKHLILTISSLLYCLCSYGQYFEYSKIIGDTTYQQWAGAAKQLDDSSFIVIGGYTYYPKANYTAGNIIFKLNKKGDTLFTSKIQLPIPAFEKYLVHNTSDEIGKWQILSSKNGYLAYKVKIDTLGNIQTFKFGCDKNGKNPYYRYQNHYSPNLDSIAVLNDARIKYIPDQGYYIYGSISGGRYQIWKLDTNGVIKRRVDYYAYYGSADPHLNLIGNKMLFTTSINKSQVSYGGIRLMWFDTTLTPLADKELWDSALVPFKSYLGTIEPIILKDTSVVLGVGSGVFSTVPWPFVLKFKPNLDTLWHAFLTIPRDSKHIDGFNDYCKLYKLVAKQDSGFAVWWGTNFTDGSASNYMANQNLLTTFKKTSKKDTTTIRLDSVDVGLPYIKGINGHSRPNDLISTLDNGYLTTGSIEHGYQHANGNDNLRVASITKFTNYFRTSIDPLTNYNNITIYPNPTIDKINITNLNNKSCQIKITDLQGRIVLIQENQTNNQINVSNLNSGIYLLQLYNNHQLLNTYKIIKQ